MKDKKILLLDMDGVLVDLQSEIHYWNERHPNIAHIYKGNEDRIPGIFRNPPPIPFAINAVHELQLSGWYDMYIATSSPWGNPEAAADKRYWIETYFGDLFKKKMFVTHRKDMLMGDYLVDDRTANGAGEFKGELIQFGSDEFPHWESVLEHLLYGWRHAT